MEYNNKNQSKLSSTTTIDSDINRDDTEIDNDNDDIDGYNITDKVKSCNIIKKHLELLFEKQVLKGNLLSIIYSIYINIYVISNEIM